MNSFVIGGGGGGASLPSTNNVLKGNGAGGAQAATAGTDFATATQGAKADAAALVSGLLFCSAGVFSAATGAQVAGALAGVDIAPGNINATGTLKLNGDRLVTAGGSGALGEAFRFWSSTQDSTIDLHTKIGAVACSSSTLDLMPNASQALRAYQSGGAFVGSTPTDPGANNLGVQGGIILTSSNGTRYQVTVANGGTLTVAAV